MSLSLIEELELQAIALRDNSLANCARWVQRAIEALESQAREIAVLRKWKGEQMSVMGPVIDYARSVYAGPPGCSLTGWLVSDHEKKAREIAGLQKLLDRAHMRMDELKAQPSGVVLPEPDFYWVEADEGSWNSPEEWAQDYYDYNGEKPESVTFSCAIELPNREYDSFEFDANGSCISCRLVNDEVARLNQPAGGVYSDDPLECTGCASGCFRCRNEPASGGDERTAFDTWFAREVWKEGCYGNPDILKRQLWPCWQARSTLSANHSEQVPHDLAMAMHQRDHYANRVFVLELGIGKIADDFIPSSDDEAPIALGEMRDALEALLAVAAPSAGSQKEQGE